MLRKWINTVLLACLVTVAAFSMVWIAETSHELRLIRVECGQ